MFRIVMVLFASLYIVGCNPAKNKFTSVNDPLAKPAPVADVPPDSPSTPPDTDPNTTSNIPDGSNPDSLPASSDDTAGTPTPPVPVPVDQLPSDPSLPGQYECKTKPGKVLICHVANCHSGHSQSLCIGAPALPAHLSHGGKSTDYLGACR